MVKTTLGFVLQSNAAPAGGQWAYDEAANAASLTLSHAPVAESDDVRRDLVLDFDAAGRILRIEVLDARALLSQDLLTGSTGGQ